MKVDRIEQFVLNTIRDLFLGAGAEARIRDSIVKALSRNVAKTGKDEKKLADIRGKIEKATENLALAAKNDFAAISKLLERWREEEAVLAERIDQLQSDIKPLPEALKVISKFGEIRGRIDIADRIKLAHAIKQTVASITIGVRPAKAGKIEYREMFGELRFHEALGGQVVPIPDEVIGQRRIWREIGVLARTKSQPVRLADVARLIDTKDASLACYHVRQAVRAGLVRKLDGAHGCVPN